MKYEKTIEAIERDVSLRFHFTDYDFLEILKMKCPRPDNSERLRSDYVNLMNRLKDFLKTDPVKESIKIFVLNDFKQIHPEEYLKEEFTLLTLKFNGFNHFMLDLSDVKDYFDTIDNKLNYFKP